MNKYIIFFLILLISYFKAFTQDRNAALITTEGRKILVGTIVNPIYDSLKKHNDSLISHRSQISQLNNSVSQLNLAVDDLEEYMNGLLNYEYKDSLYWKIISGGEVDSFYAYVKPYNRPLDSAFQFILPSGLNESDRDFFDSLKLGLIVDSLDTKLITGSGNYDSVYMYVKRYKSTTWDSTFQFLINKGGGSISDTGSYSFIILSESEGTNTQAGILKWKRNGNQVDIWGIINTNISEAGISSTVISLPIESNMDQAQCSGSGTASNDSTIEIKPLKVIKSIPEGIEISFDASVDEYLISLQTTYEIVDVSALISISPTSLTGFSTMSGVASTSQFFSVTGDNLTEDISIEAPNGYEISFSSGSGYNSNLTVPEISGEVNDVIYVRLSSSAPAGPNSGNVVLSSLGAITKNVSVGGEVLEEAEITVSPTSLSGFSTTEGNASTNQSFTLTGSNLTEDITVNAPSNYQVSLSSGSGYSSSITATETSGSVNTTIYVRISSSATPGSPSGNVTASSTGAITKNVAVSGTVTGTPNLTVNPSSLSGFTSTEGSVSTSQTFTVSGQYLVGDATVSESSDDWEISLSSGSGYTNSINLTASSGSLTGQPVTIYARITSTASVGSVSTNITVSSSGATNRTVALSGTVSPTVAAKDTARFNFSRTAKTCSDFVNVAGNVGPAGGSVRTATHNNISISTISTSNWTNLSGNTSYDGFGTQSGVFLTNCNSTTNAVMYNQYVNAANYNASVPQFRISGLKTGSTYTIRATGSVTSGSSSGRLTGIRIDGNGGIGSEYTYNPGGTSGANTTQGVTITSVVPKGDGTVDVFFYQAATTNPAIICALIIEEE